MLILQSSAFFTNFMIRITPCHVANKVDFSAMEHSFHGELTFLCTNFDKGVGFKTIGFNSENTFHDAKFHYHSKAQKRLLVFNKIFIRPVVFAEFEITF